jgi:hypothetical protein
MLVVILSFVWAAGCAHSSQQHPPLFSFQTLNLALHFESWTTWTVWPDRIQVEHGGLDGKPFKSTVRLRPASQATFDFSRYATFWDSSIHEKDVIHFTHGRAFVLSSEYRGASRSIRMEGCAIAEVRDDVDRLNALLPEKLRIDACFMTGEYRIEKWPNQVPEPTSTSVPPAAGQPSRRP